MHKSRPKGDGLFINEYDWLRVQLTFCILLAKQ